MKRIVEYGKNLSGILLATFFCFVALDVFTRNVLHVPIIWLNEGSVFAFLWMTFIAGALAFFEDLHYKVSIFSEKFEKKFYMAFLIIEHASLILFGSVLLTQGINMVKLSTKSFSPALGIRTSWILLVLPISAVLIIIASIYRFVEGVRKSKEGEVKC